MWHYIAQLLFRARLPAPESNNSDGPPPHAVAPVPDDIDEMFQELIQYCFEQHDNQSDAENPWWWK